MKKMVFVGFLVMVVLLGCNIMVDGEINELSFKQISNINKEGSYLGIVVPNPYELSPLFQSSTFVPHNKFPYFDFAGRHFRIGELEKKKVIVVMCGESMLNAGVGTQLLLTLFDVRGVLHYGIAGNLNSRHQIGDVAIPKYWAHTGEWHWQRVGDKEDGNGKFNTEFGYLKFSDYKNYTKHSESSVENVLNKVWYQPERIFPVNGTPEKWQDVFWVPVDKTYFEIARKLKAVLKVASSKVAKHEKTCSDNQHAFIPFSLDTFGFQAPDAVNILNRVQRVMHSNVVSPRSLDVVFKMIGFAIQKRLAAQLVAVLPSN